MALSLQTFTTLVRNMAAAVQGSASRAIDLTVGSTLRAILEANAAVALWMQWLILQVLALTRAATSSGTDLDSWMADFGFSRLAAVAATGSVTFSRYTATSSALIQPGVQVKTLDGTQTFTVTTDTTNSLWNAGQGGYLLVSGVASGTVPVQAVNAGTQGNVAAGTIGLLASAIPGIDTVTNALAFTNGMDAQSDPDFRTGFQGFIASRARATPDAITFAAQSVQQGLDVSVVSGVDTSGAEKPGWFVVTVDDGTGSPPSSLLDAVAVAVEAYRPIGSTAAVQRPAVTTANVNVTLTLATGTTRADVDAAVGDAVTAYIAGLGISQTLPYLRLAQVIFDASAGITGISALTVNGASADLVPGQFGVVRAGTVTVN